MWTCKPDPFLPLFYDCGMGQKKNFNGPRMFTMQLLLIYHCYCHIDNDKFFWSSFSIWWCEQHWRSHCEICSVNTSRKSKKVESSSLTFHFLHIILYLSWSKKLEFNLFFIWLEQEAGKPWSKSILVNHSPLLISIAFISLTTWFQ